MGRISGTNKKSNYSLHACVCPKAMLEREATKNGKVDLDDVDSGDLDPNV